VKIVMVELDVNTAKDAQEQNRLRTILLQNRGEETKAKIPIVAIVKSDQQRHFVRLGAQFRVQDSEATVAALLQERFAARSTTLLSG
jgi:DNA polymerase-3 subunit alpha